MLAGFILNQVYRVAPAGASGRKGPESLILHLGALAGCGALIAAQRHLAQQGPRTTMPGCRTRDLWSSG
jgi:hypothetical protein